MEKMRTSTMTACGALSANINLNNFLNNLYPNDFIQFIETNQGNKKKKKKLDKKKRKITNKRTLFFNQGTMILNFEGKLINLKIFSNEKAKIQCTGLLSEDQGKRLLEKVLKYIVDLDTNFIEENKIFNSDKVELTEFRIVMINCDYDFGFSINREKLYEDLVEADYFTTFSPDGYPGVNSKYMHNSNNTDGICICENRCTGKGCGCGDGKCRRVTMAVFQSGKMLITGAQNMGQVKDSFTFINKFITSDKNKYILR